MLQETTLFGVKVHRLTMDEAVAAVDGFLREGGPHHVVTLAQAEDLPGHGQAVTARFGDAVPTP